MKKVLFLTLTAMLVLASCSRSPLSRMQSIADDANKNGESWTEDDWKSNSEKFSVAAADFYKSDPDTEEIETAVNVTNEFLTAAGNSSLSAAYSIVNGMLDNIIKEYGNTIKKAFLKGTDELNNALQQSEDEFGDTMQQMQDDLNDMQQTQDEEESY